MEKDIAYPLGLLPYPDPGSGPCERDRRQSRWITNPTLRFPPFYNSTLTGLGQGLGGNLPSYHATITPYRSHSRMVTGQTLYSAVPGLAYLGPHANVIVPLFWTLVLLPPRLPPLEDRAGEQERRRRRGLSYSCC